MIDISKRDLGASRDAYNDFRELIQRFPQSQYAPDAQQRIVYLRELLARHELHVADYYLRRGAFLRHGRPRPRGAHCIARKRAGSRAASKRPLYAQTWQQRLSVESGH